MATVVGSLLPIVLLVLLGWSLRRGGFFADNVVGGLSKLIYHVAMPAFLIERIGTTSISWGPMLRLTGVLLVGTAAAALTAYLLIPLLRLPRRSWGAFVQASFRGNLAFIGLPVIVFYLEDRLPAARSDAVVADVVLALGPMVAVYNVAAVLVLLIHRQGDEEGRRMPLGRAVVANPLILGCAAGLLLGLAGWPMPDPVARSLELVGDIALPLALVALGASLDFGRLRGRWTPAVGAALVKLSVPLAAGWWATRLLGLDAARTTAALILLATPTAVASWVLVDRLQGDTDLATAAVLLSTLGAAVSLGLVIGLS